MASLGLTSVGYANTSNIFAGTHGIELQVTDIVVKTGEGALTEGTMLALEVATSKYVKYDANVTDGTELFAGILGCDVDATSADVDAFMYVHGAFNKSKLSAVRTIVAGSYLYGSIVIKEEY
jgi:hypothetical protein